MDRKKKKEGIDKEEDQKERLREKVKSERR